MDIRDVLKARQKRQPLHGAKIPLMRHGAHPPPRRRLDEELGELPETRAERERTRKFKAAQMRIAFVPKSPAEKLAALPKAERDRLLEELGDEAVKQMYYDWTFWARPEQLAPEEFKMGLKYGWLILAGRGSGKTRTGVEVLRDWVEELPPKHTEHHRFAIVAETAADARDVLVEGESGLLAISRPEFMPLYYPSKRLIKWPCGCMGHTYSGEEPDQLRGPQHTKALVDEFAKYQYPEDTMANLEFGLRLGENPQMVVTTTPKPIPAVKALMDDPQFVVTGGSSYSNMQNLAPAFINRVIKKHEGTRLGRQEIHAELLDDAPGALWTRARIEQNRRRSSPELQRIVVAIDPSVTATEDSDEVGITVGGLGVDGHAYMLDDLSGIFSAEVWATRAVTAFDKYEGDVIVGETNNGGDLVGLAIHNVRKTVPFRKLTASRGKHVRAEPVSQLDEQHKIHHVGQFSELEDQLVNYTKDGYVGGGSPDRGDSYVWLMTELLITPGGDARKGGYKAHTT